MSLVTRILLGLVFASMAAVAWADVEAPAPAEPAPAEEPAPAPEPPPPPEEPAPAPEPEAEAPAEEAPGNRFYAGGGLGLVENDIASDSGTVPALNLRAGYFVLPWLAVEGQLNAGLSEADLDRAQNTEIDLKRSLGIYLKPHFNFGPLDLFASIGYADVDAEVNGLPPGVDGDVGDSGLSYGFGTRIATSAGAFDFEYMKLLDERSADIEGLFFTYNRFF
ncbi:MAG: outer membrane beta-barrel protein [Nevskiales bacterium]